MSTQKQPKVAVITRTKNSNILLERALKSVHQQTMEDFVHIIYNDSGDEAAVEMLLEKYKDITKGRVRLIHNKVSSGPDAAFNTPIKSVESKYIAIHDDDDSWHPRFLELTVGHLESTDIKGVIARTDRIYEAVSNGVIHFQDRDQYMPHLSHFSLYDLFAENFAVPISFVYKREVYDKIGYYNEDIKVSGDWEFALRFMRAFDIDKIDPGYALAFYHVRPSTAGVLGNSIYDPKKPHIQYHTVLANRFLREDINKGALGFGYLFNVANAERARGWELDEIHRKLDDVAQQLDQQARLIDDSRLNFAKIKTSAKEKAKNIARKVKSRIKG